MNTKIILTASAIVLGLTGITFSFFPEELLRHVGIGSIPIARIALQLLGALYFAFAMLNWMAKGAIIGGIYNKPVATANLAHFFIGAAALVKALLHNYASCWLLWLAAGVYLVFAVCFGLIFTGYITTKPTE